MPIIKTRERNGHITKVINYAFGFLFFVWLVAGSIILYDTYQDRKLVLILKAPVELFQDSELGSSSKIGIITPGDHVKILRTQFVKDHFVIHVQVVNGQSGWILKTNEIDLK